MASQNGGEDVQGELVQPITTADAASKMEGSNKDETAPQTTEEPERPERAERGVLGGSEIVAVQETPGVSSDAAEPEATTAKTPTLPPIAAAQTEEEVQRAEIHFGDAGPAQPDAEAAEAAEALVPSSRGSLPPVARPGPRASPPKPSAKARARIIAAREELERRVQEATEARLRRQEEQELLARQRAEEAQLRAKKRLAQKKRAEAEGHSPASASAPESSRRSGRSASPDRGGNAQGGAGAAELPGIKPAKARVRKKILKQRQEQEQRLREIEEDRERLELRKKAELEAAEVHRLEAARRAALRFRRERRDELKAKAEQEEEQRQARERQKLYRNPQQIAKIIAEAQVQSQVQERRRSAQHAENHLARERLRAQRLLDGEPQDAAEERRPFGERFGASKTREYVEDPDGDFFAKTVHALTDEDWKVNIKFS